MLQLINIQKDYAAGSGVVHALKGIDLQFRENEFVSILGPSGSGKSFFTNHLVRQYWEQGVRREVA